MGQPVCLAHPFGAWCYLFIPIGNLLFGPVIKTAITSVIAVWWYGLSNQGINTSIDPSAVMLT
jgi:hypothetical protein